MDIKRLRQLAGTQKPVQENEVDYNDIANELDEYMHSNGLRFNSEYRYLEDDNFGTHDTADAMGEDGIDTLEDAIARMTEVGEWGEGPDPFGGDEEYDDEEYDDEEEFEENTDSTLDRLRQLAGTKQVNELGFQSGGRFHTPRSPEEIKAMAEETKDMCMELARNLETLAPLLGLDEAELREISDTVVGLAGDLDSLG